MKSTINDILISRINSHTSKIGYRYKNFDSLYNENVEINSINLEYVIKHNNDININNYISCLNNVFVINQGKLNKKNKEVFLSYKRVSSFQNMDSMNKFITNMYKNNMSNDKIVERLKNNYSIDRRETIEKITNWYSEINQEVQSGDNRRLRVVDNPGFDLTIVRETQETTEGFQNILQLNVYNIDNINYLENIDKYINILFLLIKKDTGLSEEKIQSFVEFLRK